MATKRLWCNLQDSKPPRAVIAFDPAQVCGSASATASVCKALSTSQALQYDEGVLFHEGLHGKTNLFDNPLEGVFGICSGQTSGAITEYLNFWIFGLGGAPTTPKNQTCTQWPWRQEGDLLTMRMWHILPIIQAILAVVLLKWGEYHPHPTWWRPGMYEFWRPTSDLVCYGINAPAFRLVPALYSFALGKFIPPIGGFYSQDLFLLAGVIVL